MSKHKAIPKKLRIALHKKYNHKCAYCGCDLEYREMQVDHIKPVYTNTDIRKVMSEDEMYDITNLLPTCRQCNFYKSTMKLEDFRERIRTVMWENLKKNFNYRLALKYGLIQENDHPITFYYETLSSKETEE